MAVHKDVKKTIAELIQRFGGTVGCGTNHKYLRLPNGRKVTLPSALSDPRTLKNLRCQVARVAAGGMS